MYVLWQKYRTLFLLCASRPRRTARRFKIPTIDKTCGRAATRTKPQNARWTLIKRTQSTTTLPYRRLVSVEWSLTTNTYSTVLYTQRSTVSSIAVLTVLDGSARAKLCAEFSFRSGPFNTQMWPWDGHLVFDCRSFNIWPRLDIRHAYQFTAFREADRFKQYIFLSAFKSLINKYSKYVLTCWHDCHTSHNLSCLFN